MADRDEAESADESTPAVQPGQPTDPSRDEALAEHVAPDDAREPTLDELEHLFEADDSGADDPSVDDASVLDDDPAEPDAEVAQRDAHDEDGDGDDLVGVGAAPSGRRRSGRSAGGATAVARAGDAPGASRTKKDKATPKQRRDVEKPKRTTPASFTREAVGELRKVVYPTASQLGNYFVVVLVFVLVIVGFVYLLDLGFGWVIVKIFG